MIVIYKSKRELSFTNDSTGEVTRFCVSLGFCPTGKKTREGDGKTPEGKYRIVSKNYASKYHVSLGLNYPNAIDAKKAIKRAEISFFDMLRITLSDILHIRPPYNTPLGGFIMIHGTGSNERAGDWTAGCISVSNDQAEYLSRVCRRGERVIIFE